MSKFKIGDFVRVKKGVDQYDMDGELPDISARKIYVVHAIQTTDPLYYSDMETEQVHIVLCDDVGSFTLYDEEYFTKALRRKTVVQKPDPATLERVLRELKMWDDESMARIGYELHQEINKRNATKAQTVERSIEI